MKWFKVTLTAGDIYVPKDDNKAATWLVIRHVKANTKEMAIVLLAQTTVYSNKILDVSVEEVCECPKDVKTTEGK